MVKYTQSAFMTGAVVMVGADYDRGFYNVDAADTGCIDAPDYLLAGSVAAGNNTHTGDYTVPTHVIRGF